MRFCKGQLHTINSKQQGDSLWEKGIPQNYVTHMEYYTIDGRVRFTESIKIRKHHIWLGRKGSVMLLVTFGLYFG